MFVMQCDEFGKIICVIGVSPTRCLDGVNGSVGVDKGADPRRCSGSDIRDVARPSIRRPRTACWRPPREPSAAHRGRTQTARRSSTASSASTLTTFRVAPVRQGPRSRRPTMSWASSVLTRRTPTSAAGRSQSCAGAFIRVTSGHFSDRTHGQN